MTCKCTNIKQREINVEMSEGLTLIGATYREHYCADCGRSVKRTFLHKNYRRYANNVTGMQSPSCTRPQPDVLPVDILLLSDSGNLKTYTRNKAFPAMADHASQGAFYRGMRKS